MNGVCRQYRAGLIAQRRAIKQQGLRSSQHPNGLTTKNTMLECYIGSFRHLGKRSFESTLKSLTSPSRACSWLVSRRPSDPQQTL